jgi:alpha-methylacyl-CoA racemase
MAVGCIEPQFFALMMQLLDLDADRLPGQHDGDHADELREAIATAFESKTMPEWTEVFAGTDACVTPVLTYAEALHHPHLRDRGVFTTIDGVDQPRPAPRFSRTPWAEPTAPEPISEGNWLNREKASR